MAAVYPAGPLPIIATSYVVSGKFPSSVRSDDPRQTNDSRPASRPWDGCTELHKYCHSERLQGGRNLFFVIVVNRQVSRKSLGTASLLEITQARVRGSVTPAVLLLPLR